jgi:DNA-binding HxlR family transcriptional regulator
MENNNLIEKRINNHETEYFLTSKGMKLNRVLYELIIFALDNHEEDFYTDDEIMFIKETYIDILDL